MCLYVQILGALYRSPTIVLFSRFYAVASFNDQAPVSLNLSPSLDVRESREFASEIKFQVADFAGEAVLEWARAHLSPDPNAANGEQNDAYQITSIYFDTEEYDVYHRNGSFGRSKYRVRRYGPNRMVSWNASLRLAAW